jgi:hypothetical protein
MAACDVAPLNPLGYRRTLRCSYQMCQASGGCLTRSSARAAERRRPVGASWASPAVVERGHAYDLSARALSGRRLPPPASR